MSSGTYIMFTFANNLAYDLVTDGKMVAWGSEESGRFSSDFLPAKVGAGDTGIAFRAQGRSQTDTGVTGAVNYWMVSAGTPMNSGKTNTKGSIQLYFSIAYDHDLYSNKWNNHVNASGVTMTSTGWSSNASAVNLLLKVDQA